MKRGEPSGKALNSSTDIADGQVQSIGDFAQRAKLLSVWDPNRGGFVRLPIASIAGWTPVGIAVKVVSDISSAIPNAV